MKQKNKIYGLNMLFFLNVLVLINLFSCQKGNLIETTACCSFKPEPFKYNADVPGIEQNPMKGLVPYSWQVDNTSTMNEFPFSLEFNYIPLSDVMHGIGQFDWTTLEGILNKSKSRHNQAIIRFYLDYPNRAIATPQFLIDQGVIMSDYTDYGNSTSKSPDWNNPLMMNALQNFITAFGKKYDGDPRIGFITLGLYGFWGEWHTGSRNDWRMSESNKTILAETYKSVFKTTLLHVRDPNAILNDNSLLSYFGFHDDSWAYNTVPDGKTWYFVDLLQQRKFLDFWKTKPLGGEVRPIIWLSLFDSWDNTSNGAQSISKCNELTHPTWLMDMKLFDQSATNVQKSNALKQHKLMGYQLFISDAKITEDDGISINLTINIENRGVAPFYYEWPVEFFAYSAASEKIEKSLGSFKFDWLQIQPDGNSYSRDVTLQIDLPKGQYQLIMRVKNPLTDLRPLRFANDSQDKHVTGYLSLGSLEVSH